MANKISDLLRVTILSLKQIGDFVKKIGSFTDPSETVAHKLENIRLDTTELAKQGSDTSVSLTSIDTKIGVSPETPKLSIFDTIGTVNDIIDLINGGDVSAVIDAFTQDYADELATISGLPSIEQQISYLRTLQQSYNDLVVTIGKGPMIIEATSQQMTDIVNRIKQR